MSAKPKTLRITAEELVRALYGEPIDYVNRGVYPGTKIPWRKVPPNAMLTIRDEGAIRVSDDDGGWIADRICEGTIGRGQWNRLIEGHGGSGPSIYMGRAFK